jgi:hypothetical protein
VATSNPQYLRSPFPGNMIPASRLDPIAQGVLKYVDLPNLASLPLAEGQYLNNTPLTEDNDQFSVRADYSLSQKDQIFGRYSWSKESVSQPGALSTQGVFRNPRPQIVTVGSTHVFTPSVLNDLSPRFHVA